jgi:hypothetical protein
LLKERYACANKFIEKKLCSYKDKLFEMHCRLHGIFRIYFLTIETPILVFC